MSFFKIIMEALQYRSTVWICRQTCQDTAIPQETCHPVPLFVLIMKNNPTWGRYAVYITSWAPHAISFTRTDSVSLFKDTLSRLDVFILVSG